MLNNNKLTAFLPARNLSAAVGFYKEILSLKLISWDNYALEFDANGTKLRITHVKDFTPHSFTVLGWEVEDIKSTVVSLNSKEIFFEKYDSLAQDDLGIWTAPGGTKVAWFKDPDGNLISLSET